MRISNAAISKIHLRAFRADKWIAIIAFACVSTAVGASIVESGHSGIWRSIERSGEGITLEILDEDRAGMAWFTYDDRGGQRWAFSVGDIIRANGDAYIEFRDVFTVQGGIFGAAYDPATVQVLRVGSAMLRFEDCERGVFAFDVFGQTLALNYQRLTSTMAAGCAPIQGVPGQPIQEYAGQSGVWSDPARRGQGFQLQWMPNNTAGLGWYTYDRAGKQFWLTGVGHPEGGKIVFPSLIATRGGKFGAAFRSSDIEVIQWGRLELEIDCDNGTARYQSDSFGSGEQPIYALTRSVPVGCPYEKPKLTDLYDLHYTALPIPMGTFENPNAIEAQGIADNGSVVAVLLYGINKVARLTPGSASWEVLESDPVVNVRAYISPDGARISASLWGEDDIQRAMEWTEESGWTALPGQLSFYRQVIYGTSQNGEWLTGNGRFDGDVKQYAWTWNRATGQKLIRPEPNDPGLVPVSLSNSGSPRVGAMARFVGVTRTVGVYWPENAPPAPLIDAYGAELGTASDCNETCSLVFGQDQVLIDETHPHPREPWYWTPTGGAVYLGRPSDFSTDAFVPAGVADVSKDGSIAVGAYLRNVPTQSTPRYDGWIWTQNTGMVSIGGLLTELDLAPQWTSRSAASVSSDGLTILLSGYNTVPNSTLRHYQAGILRLVPKPASPPAAAPPDGASDERSKVREQGRRQAGNHAFSHRCSADRYDRIRGCPRRLVQSRDADAGHAVEGHRRADRNQAVSSPVNRTLLK